MLARKSVFVIALMLVGLCLSFVDAEARLWNRAEWHFNAGFDKDELKADVATDNMTLLRLNVSGSKVYSVAHGRLVCSGSKDLLEFIQVDINDMLATGGKRVNEYSMIFDIVTDSTPSDIGLFNAELANKDDGELFLDGRGNLGSGSIYSSGSPVKPQAWARVVVTYREDGGAIYENIYVDGVNVLKDVKRDAVDRGFSLATNAESDAYQIALFGANMKGLMYLDSFTLENFGFILNELTAEEVSWLGDVNPNGIGLSKLKTPRIDVKANGLDAGVVVPIGARTTLTYDLEARAATGRDAEVWLVAVTPFGPFSYDSTGPYNGWRYMFSSPLLSGPLTDLSGTAIDTRLPSGPYDVYFGIEWLLNGTIDNAYIFDLDMVDLDVQ